MNPQGGYIALMSALIISVILIGFLTTLSLGGFFGRFNVLNSEFKERSAAVAEGCANAAISRMGGDVTYAGNEDLVFGGNTCHVFPLEAGPASGQKTIK